MKDAIGRELHVGDWVAVSSTGWLRFGWVVRVGAGDGSRVTATVVTASQVGRASGACVCRAHALLIVPRLAVPTHQVEAIESRRVHLSYDPPTDQRPVDVALAVAEDVVRGLE